MLVNGTSHTFWCDMKLRIKNIKPVNLVAKDLHTAKYRMRVVSPIKAHDRKNEKKMVEKELMYV